MGRMLISAAEENNIEQLKALLSQKDIDVNFQNRIGDTALIYAAYKGHIECVKVLIKAGADLSIKENNYKTAEDWARNNGHTKIITLFEQEKLKTLDEWKKIGSKEIAHIYAKPIIYQKITEVFNFKAGERTTTIFDIQEKAQSSFQKNMDKINDIKSLETAAEKLLEHGGDKIDIPSIISPNFIKKGNTRINAATPLPIKDKKL